MNKDAVFTALDRDQISCLIQPKYQLTSGDSARLIGGEMLAHWQVGGAHISALDYMDYIIEGGRELFWVERSIQRSVYLYEEGGVCPISINISASLVQDALFLSRCAANFGLAHSVPDIVQFEIVETVDVSDLVLFSSSLSRLSSLGYHVMYDDFGTGFSNLRWLMVSGCKEIKVDRCFVMGVHLSLKRQKIIKSIVALADSLDLDVIAEGVESRGELEFLSSIGVDRIQGYFFGRPESKSDYLLRDYIISF